VFGKKGRRGGSSQRAGKESRGVTAGLPRARSHTDGGLQAKKSEEEALMREGEKSATKR